MDAGPFALHFLLHSADLVDGQLRRRLGEIGLRPRQARVIDALARIGPTSQVSLAREFDVTPASMSTMTARLIEAGYVSREVDPREARSNVLRLTRSGRVMLTEIHAAWRDIDHLIEARIGTQRAAELAELTRALRDSLGGRAPGAQDDDPPPPERPT